MIIINNLIKYYDHFKALNNISFNVESGKITCLIGKNGAGKTTIIKCINRLLSPDKGTILFNNKNIFEMNLTEYKISYIPDAPVYFEELSVFENLMFISKIFHKATVEVKDIIDLIGLGEYYQKLPSQLSKGNKQKLSIAMAMLRDFDILIADEPFSGLDPKQIQLLKNIFIELRNNNKYIILSSHLLDLVETFADNYIFIDQGTLLECTSTDKLNQSKTKKSLQEFFVDLVDNPKEE